ncbi:MAG: HAMP domain-containing sensor histidine kinase [Rikenellaceae bacterium]
MLVYVGYVVINVAIVCYLLYMCVLVANIIEIDVNYLSYCKIGLADVMLLSIIAISCVSIYTIDIFERRILERKQYLLLSTVKCIVTICVLLIFHKLYGYSLIYILGFVVGVTILNILTAKLINKNSIYAVVNVFVAIVLTVFMTESSNVSKKQRLIEVSNIAIENSLNTSTVYSFIMLPDEYKEIFVSNISYVKLKNGIIVESLGKLASEDIVKVAIDDKFIISENHIYYKRTKGGVEVIVGYPINNKANYLLLSILIFVFIQVVVFLLMGTWFFFPELNFITKSIYAKLRVVVFLVCIVSAFAVLVFVNNYISNSQEDEEMIRLTTKVKHLSSVLIDEFKTKDFSVEELDDCLKSVKKGLNVDVNVYDSSGKIIYTSDSEALDNKLVSFYVYPRYYDYINYNSVMLLADKAPVYNGYYYTTIFSLEIADSERIYVQIFDLGTLDVSLKETLKIDIINLFIVIFGVMFVLLIVFYNRTMKPLLLLKDYLSRFKYRKRIDSMMYKKGTEIDDLIDLYNNAIDELENTLVKLAETGRIEALTVLTRQIAHELRNPLTPIKLKVQMLLRRKHNGDKDWDNNIEESLNIIITQIDILEKTINQLSSLTSVSSTTVDRVNIDNMMNEIKSFYDGYPNIDITYVNKTHNEDIFIVMSYDNLWSVLTNIMVNAISAIGKRSDGEINMELNLTDYMIIMSIKDNGGGINEEIKDRIFAPSFTTKKSGSGIGLTIASGIVRNAGGQIYFESEKDVGATFFIEVPILQNKVEG